ncbi:MAG: tRNA lysidine(34) synthetase TilS [Acidobacteria bacterium]|jgi:tRNA(Ile)-lysidine synthase|nr:tRNA lysidine(34) synthetase TilS [Acidobacteriota bacterium]
MNQFSKNLLTEWRKLNLPFADGTFVTAVSGGADSVSLMLALHELRKLKKLNLRFVIAHFNHDLRGDESDSDENFVKKLAGEFNFELVLGKEKIINKGNLEQSARNARYKFLVETAENLHADGILTAHTLNDQAETFLSNLIRGSGLEGLGGMRAMRSLKSEVRRQKPEARSQKSEVESKIQNPKSKIQLIRPLLNWAKREDTENFCRLNEVEFCSDSMNEDLTFNRVRIRKVLLPLLQDFNPKIIEALANTASLLREDAEFLEAATQKIGSRQLAESSFSKEVNSTNNDQTTLQIKDLKNLFPSMRRRILRDWLKNQRGDLRSLDAKHIEAIENLIFSRKSGKQVELPNGEILTKNKGSLSFGKKV